MADLNALHGDGINFPFFELLWSKNCDDNQKSNRKMNLPARDSTKRRHIGKSEARTPPILRVPDTVVFLFGQPHQWYFTSKNGGPDKNKTTIMRKRRGNLTLANIEEVLLNKAASRGKVEDTDIVAYFITSKGGDVTHNDQRARSYTDGSSCNIEYFNKRTLHEFLQQGGRNNKSGILQRFVNPYGGRHNSQIRAIWTPKLCVLERRRTKQDLQDTRFALCERAITFDGPDVHSILLPLRGTVLAGKVEKICNEMVRHIEDVTAENSHESIKGHVFLEVARMVANFKIDGNGKIWILWTNSIRLNTMFDSNVKLTDSDSHSSSQVASSHPLNTETVVSLPSSIKLTQAPNHNANMKLDNESSFATCPSCNKEDPDPHFQAVPYKTIIQHFTKTLEMLEERDESLPSKVWPPESSFIKAAGSVGFGALPSQLIHDRETNPNRKYSEETHMIPPVIRHIHPKLRAKGYATYRNDPLFLLKTCRLCEDCFLAYAEMTSTSFIHMTRPIEPPKDNYHYDFPKEVKSKSHDEGKKLKNASPFSNHPSLFGKDFGSAPKIPPAIMEPPETSTSPSILSKPAQPKDSLLNTLPTYFPSTDCAEKNLGHMIDLQMMMKAATEKAQIEIKNPYEEDLVLSLVGR